MEHGGTIEERFEPVGDIIVVAGDLDVGAQHVYKSLMQMVRHSGHRPIVYCPGNHEYYGTSPEAFHVELQPYIEMLKAQNVFVLNNEWIEINGVVFIGAVGWTDNSHMRHSPSNSWMMSDFKEIEGFAAAEGGTNWGKQHYHFLNHALTHTKGWKRVVITHHAPLPKSIAPQFQYNTLNAYFVNDWRSLFFKFNFDLWVHGHTHESFHYEFANKRVICNPFGYYRRKENDRYDPTFLFEIPLGE
jgi:Icc-related predicted phosphoesterase